MEIGRLGGWAVSIPSLEITWSAKVHDIHETPRDWSPTFEQALAFYVPECIAEITQHFYACANEGIPFDRELAITTAKGRRVWVRAIGEAVRDDAGKIVRVQGAFQDISEQRRIVEAPSEFERSFLELATHVADVFYSRAVQDERVLYVSPAYERIWGRTCASLYAAPQSWKEAIHPEDRVAVADARRAQNQGARTDIEYRVVHPDGTVHWVHEQSVPVNDGGRVDRVVGTVRDVTERHRSEEQLAQNAALLDQASDAIIVSDLDFQISFWNRRAGEMYGWSSEEVKGRRSVDLFADAATTQSALASLLRTGEWTGETVHKTRSGNALTAPMDSREQLRYHGASAHRTTIDPQSAHG
jgi:PAS domain S-box-containing protein